jgi:hypothetical protein
LLNVHSRMMVVIEPYDLDFLLEMNYWIELLLQITDGRAEQATLRR